MAITASEIRELVETRRMFHRIPELGFQERKTGEIIAARLEEYGYGVCRGVGETGVVGLMAGKEQGPTLLLRADIDGLPTEERNDHDYRSTHAGVMHACGHDGHIAMMLMAARRLATTRSSLQGNLKVVFQPAEELLSGARRMIDDGVLEEPRVNAAFGLHLWNNLDTGDVGVVTGPMMAAIDRFEIVVKGRGGHGGMPHQTVDAVAAASHMVAALQTIVSRNIDPLDSAVVTVGSIHAGSAFNIVAETATLTGTVRTLDPATREALPKLMERIVGGVAQALGAEYELRYDRLCGPTVNDPAMAELARGAAAEVVGARRVVETREARTTCGEDMSEFLNRAPGCYIFVGSRNRSKGLDQPHHSSNFDFDEAALPIGVEILERLALRYLMSG